MREKVIEELARDLEKPRALLLLAEWIAIEHDKTRLQADEYMEAAQGLCDWLQVIGFRLIPLVREEIKQTGRKEVVEWIDGNGIWAQVPFKVKESEETMWCLFPNEWQAFKQETAGALIKEVT